MIFFFNLCSRGGWLTHCHLEDVHKVFKILSSIFQQAYIVIVNISTGYGLVLLGNKP